MKNRKKDTDREFRAIRFRYAVGSSVASKIATAAVQIIAMPVAALSLGSHGFALYAMLSAAVAWLTLSNLGIGPVLTVRLASAHAMGKMEDERNIFSSAFFPSLIISSLVSLSSLLTIWLVPIENIFGPLYVADLPTIRSGLTVFVGIFYLHTNLSLFEYAQSGYQEQYVQNLVSALSSVLSLLALLIFVKFDPTPVGLIFALNSPVVLLRFCNAIFVMLRYSHTRPSLKAFRWSICKTLMQNGAIYSLAGGVGNFLAHILPVILIGRLFSAESSAAFAATMNLLILASGVISMLSTPLWPAIADSIARGDRAWAERAYNRLLLAVMTFGFGTALALAFKGEWIFEIWFKGHINPAKNLILGAALYFVASCWESAHFSVLVGLHKISVASVLVFMRTVLGILAISVCLSTGGDASVFVIMFFSILLVDFIPLRMMVKRSLSTG